MAVITFHTDSSFVVCFIPPIAGLCHADGAYQSSLDGLKGTPRERGTGQPASGGRTRIWKPTALRGLPDAPVKLIGLDAEHASRARDHLDDVQVAQRLPTWPRRTSLNVHVGLHRVHAPAHDEPLVDRPSQALDASLEVAAKVARGSQAFSVSRSTTPMLRK